MTSPAQVDPPGQLARLLTGYMVTQSLYVVAKLGVADALAEGPLDVEALANRVGAHAGALFRVMRALTSVGIFAQPVSRTFALAPLGEALKDGPRSLRYLALLFGQDMYRAWGDVEHAVRTGESAFEHTFGQSHFEYMTSNAEAAATFNRAMAGSSSARGDSLFAYPWRDARQVIDVGGGSGRLLAELLTRQSHLRGIVFDLPHVAAEASRVLAAEGLGEHCVAVGGDYFNGVPEGGDVYMLVRVLHDWNDEDAVRILQSCGRVMNRGTRLLVLDAILDETDSPNPAKWIDLQMLVVTGGRERTRPEWEALLAQAGLRLDAVEPGMLIAALG
jgi:SAM-dependent methyltransferase